jgi:hypothetical protein
MRLCLIQKALGHKSKTSKHVLRALLIPTGQNFPWRFFPLKRNFFNSGFHTSSKNVFPGFTAWVQGCRLLINHTRDDF